VIQGFLDVSAKSAGDGFGQYGPDPLDDLGPQHYLDSEPARDVLNKLEIQWIEARDMHSDNRREMMIDADYYDCIQWRQDQAQVLLDRGQAPMTFPIIKQLADWIIGTERRTRIDWDVLPRKDDNVQMAQVKKEVLKFISDVNGAGWERSQQFADVVKVGVGWTEECANNDEYEEKVTVRYVDWKAIWWDPYSRSNTLRDCRYIHRVKWLDLDYAMAMFPDRAEELKNRAVDSLDPVLESLELEASLPMMFWNMSLHTPLRGTATGVLGLMGGAPGARKTRKRVLCLETWFRKAVNVPLLVGGESDPLNGQLFDPKNADQGAALMNGTVSLVDSVNQEMWLALWTPGCLLRLTRTPYRHKKFPFTPAWGYRRHRDGMPYGVIRPARDAQDEYNKRRSKILFDLSTNQVLYEVGAIDEANLDEVLDEAKRPDGEIRLNKGALSSGAFRIERGTDRVQGQIEMLQEAKQNIYEGGGVTRENTGTSSGDQSGRAILAKQQQGSVTTAELFDNFRQAIQESGQKTLSNCEQFLTLPKIIRITGGDGALKWLTINQPSFDPATGQVLWKNDITADEADFVVDETDYRETVRMAMAESLFELIGRLPPTLAMALLDVAVDMTDLPNKQDLANRIRAVTGQSAPGTEDTPEAQAAAQAKAQQDQQQQELAKAQSQANLDLTNAKTTALRAKADLDATTAQHRAVEGKAAAMETANMVQHAPNLASAADKIWNPATALPMRPNNYVPQEP
jgi:hypothetical protein